MMKLAYYLIALSFVTILVECMPKGENSELLRENCNETERVLHSDGFVKYFSVSVKCNTGVHPRVFSYIEAETLCKNPVTGKRLDTALYESHVYDFPMNFSVRYVSAPVKLPIGAICRKRVYDVQVIAEDL